MLNIYKGKYNQFLCENSEETDIDGGAITLQIKTELTETATALVKLQNTAAGGGDTEILEVDYTIGSFRLKFAADLFDDIDIGYYWAEAKIIISSVEYMLFQTKVNVLPTAVA